MQINRRRFLENSAAGLAATLLPVGDRLFAAPAQGGPFTLPLLGDLHFDRSNHHDMEWLAREQPNDVHQVEEYTRMTSAVMPNTFAEVKGAIAAAKQPVPFVLHMGDFVEGVCGSPELAARQCREAIQFQRDTALGVPFVFTKGNHDVTGPGAVDAFNQVLLPFIGGQARQDLKSACYAVKQADSLFLFFDAYRPESLDWFEQALAKRDARHLFVVIHPPVVPFNARANWHIFSKPQQQAKRDRLLGLLGHHQAIVLCGHLHKYNLTVRKTKEGRFVQVCLSSVIPDPNLQPKDVLEGVDKYTPDLVRLEPKFDAASETARRDLLTAEAPFIERFEYADTAGYGLLTVAGPKVNLAVYNGLGKRKWKELDLTAALAGKDPRAKA